MTETSSASSPNNVPKAKIQTPRTGRSRKKGNTIKKSNLNEVETMERRKI
jgi:hypothetical protein